MADTKVENLTANTTPALTDRLYIVDDPAGSPLGQYITVQNLRGGYTLQAGCIASNPADATTYYFGSRFAVALDTAPALSILWVPRAGTITAVRFTVLTLGTLGSAGDSTLSLRLNNTSDTTISSAVNNTSAGLSGSATPSIAVAAGDFLEFKWVTPTWGTNPTSVSFIAVVYIS